MNSIYLIVILIIVKLFHYLNKSNSRKEKQICYESNSEEEADDFKSSIEMPKEFGKNRWLHPTNEFGKEEEGVVDYETRNETKRKRSNLKDLETLDMKEPKPIIE
jgi:hypothetical protein